MMEFVLMTLSFTVAILLATVIMIAIVMNKKVMKAYMKWVNKMSREIVDEMFDDSDEAKDL